MCDPNSPAQSRFVYIRPRATQDSAKSSRLQVVSCIEPLCIKAPFSPCAITRPRIGPQVICRVQLTSLSLAIPFSSAKLRFLGEFLIPFAARFMNVLKAFASGGPD